MGQACIIRKVLATKKRKAVALATTGATAARNGRAHTRTSKSALIVAAQSAGTAQVSNPQEQPNTLAVSADYINGDAPISGGSPQAISFKITHSGTYDLSSLTVTPPIKPGDVSGEHDVYDAVQGAPAPRCLASWLLLDYQQLPSGSLAKAAVTFCSVDLHMTHPIDNTN